MTSQDRIHTEALFIPGGVGNIFVLLKRPQQPTQKVVVLIPPFAEEMNKSRRMFSLLSEQLVREGVAVLVFDFYGTGDSEADFADARWDIWRQDLHKVLAWLNERGMQQQLVLALRSGALIAADYLQQQVSSSVKGLVLWQPVLKGDVVMTQFLRLRLAASMMDNTANKETTGSLRELSKQGQVLEIAGYDLHPDLLKEIDEQQLSQSLAQLEVPIHWFEVVGTQGKGLSIASKRVLETLQDRTPAINTQVVVGASFWTSQEISTAPELISVSVEAIAGCWA